MKKFKEAELQVVKFEDSIFTESWCNKFKCPDGYGGCPQACLDAKLQEDCREFGLS